MKKLIILIFLFLLGCSTIQYTDNIKVIKYIKFNKIKYDWYSDIKIEGNYCLYIKKELNKYKTNYIHGDFELINYNEYLRSKK